MLDNLPYLGFGLGLRSAYYQEILDKSLPIDWFEILTENYLTPGGQARYYLSQIQERYPIVMHGVSLSIGSTDPLNWDYLSQVKNLAHQVQAAWISDHLCWTGINQLNTHDLLPLPYTQEALSHVVNRISQVQDYLGQRILLENVSSYLTYQHSELTEWEFLKEVALQADCYLLVDINNIYVSSVNHQFNPIDYLSALPKSRIKQFHLAGHTRYPTHIVDTHDAPITKPVWDLYLQALTLLGPISTLIERDDNYPPLTELVQELTHAKTLATQVLCHLDKIW